MRANRSLGETRNPDHSTTQTFRWSFSTKVVYYIWNFIPEISVKQPRPLSGPVRFLVGRLAAFTLKVSCQKYMMASTYFHCQNGTFLGEITIVTEPQGSFNIKKNLLWPFILSDNVRISFDHLSFWITQDSFLVIISKELSCYWMGL